MPGRGSFDSAQDLYLFRAPSTKSGFRYPELVEGCREEELNLHALRHTLLKRACLPFHHPGFEIASGLLYQGQEFRRGEGSYFLKFLKAFVIGDDSLDFICLCSGKVDDISTVRRSMY